MRFDKITAGNRRFCSGGLKVRVVPTKPEYPLDLGFAGLFR